MMRLRSRAKLARPYVWCLIFLSAPDAARAAPYRRENSGGTARDVVFPLVRWRPRVSLTPGAGHPRGRSMLRSSTRVSFFRSPPVPRAVPPRRLISPVQERWDAWKR